MQRLICTVFAVASFASAALAGPLAPPAGPVAPTNKTIDEAEPSTPINDTNTPGTTSARFRISQPGSYHLTGDFFTEQNKAGIEIAASGVRLDLRGFTIRGSNLFVTNSLDGIRTDAPNIRTDITIRNGVVRDFKQRGINMEDARRVTLESLSIIANGLEGCRLGTGSRALNCEASENTGSGFFVIGGVLRDCVARENAANGYFVTDATVHACVAIGNGRGFAGARSTATDCVANDNTELGFSSSHLMLRNCTAANNGLGGFGGSAYHAIGCTAVSNSGDGFRADNARISDCVADNNTGSGFDILASGTLSDCLARDNDGVGFQVFADCTLRNNHATINAIGFQLRGNGNFASGNTARNNSTNWDVNQNNACRVIVAALSTSFTGDAGGATPAGGLSDVNFSIVSP